jgi:hypothetical protein
VPASLKLQEEYGDQIQVIFVESQGATPAAAEKFAFQRSWLSGPSMWTSERPFNTGSGGLPNFALLSHDGEVLLKGNPMAMKGQIEEAIEAEVRKGKKAPEGTPKALEKAWKEFRKGEYAKAIALAKKAGAKAEMAEDSATTVELFEARAGAALEEVKWCMENGYLTQAEDRLKVLSKSLKGQDELVTRASALEEELGSEAYEAEWAACKAFEKLMSKVNRKGADERTGKSLEAIAEKHPGTKNGERAARTASMLS